MNAGENFADSGAFDFLSEWNDIRELSQELQSRFVESPPIVKLTNGILAKALSEKATHLHVEPGAEPPRFRYRVNGVLEGFPVPSALALQLVVARLKLLGDLDTGEWRVPQNGELDLSAHSISLDTCQANVHVVPTSRGEKAVVHFEFCEEFRQLEQLGLSQQLLAKWCQLLERPRGLILVSGGLGCGKGSTLYASLRYLESSSRNITTIEGRPKSPLPGMNQIVLHPKAGVVYSSALRAAVMQDSDVIMLSELRGRDVVDLALETAYTGRLVISALHHDRAHRALSHLLGMGVDRALLGEALAGVLAQRLVHGLCPHCQEVDQTPHSAVDRLFPDNRPQLFRSRGCPTCRNSGRRRGRVALYEFLPINDTMGHLLLKDPSGSQILDFAHREAAELGYRSFAAEAWSHLNQGQIAFDELLHIETL